MLANDFLSLFILRKSIKDTKKVMADTIFLQYCKVSWLTAIYSSRDESIIKFNRILFLAGNSERAPSEFEFHTHWTTALGNQASTIETIIDGFPEAVLLGQNNYLSTDLDKWSGRSKTEFYLKTEYLDSVHENIDDNDHQADLRQAAFHQVCDLSSSRQRQYYSVLRKNL